MATFTITTPANQDARILAAFGVILELPGPATGADVKAYILKHLVTAVKRAEYLAATKAVPEPTPITPS